MRTLFNRVLVDIAQRDERIWMILADIGYGEIEPFRDAFPIAGTTAAWPSRT